MKKLLILVIGFNISLGFSQTVNEVSNGYFEIVKVDSLKKIEIYNKLKEWISINYKSAKDVIQLDSEEKLITKGNFVVNFNVGEHSFNYRISNTLILGIRDGKYKIDLIPTGTTPVDYPNNEIGESFIKMYLSEKIKSKEEFITYSKEAAELMYINMGYNKKKTTKLLSKLDNYMDIGYSNYLSNFKTLQTEIKIIFSSIKDKVLEKDEW